MFRIKLDKSMRWTGSFNIALVSSFFASGVVLFAYL